MSVKRSVRISTKASDSLTRIAKEKGCTETAVIDSALKMYSDYCYMQEHATIIPQEIVRVLQATIGVMEQRINNKTNQVLSALAIETCTLEQVVANSLDIDKAQVTQYRKNAVDYLKANQRVFRLDEVVE